MQVPKVEQTTPRIGARSLLLPFLISGCSLTVPNEKSVFGVFPIPFQLVAAIEVEQRRRRAVTQRATGRQLVVGRGVMPTRRVLQVRFRSVA